MLQPPFYIISDTHWGHHNIIKYCNRSQDHEQIMVDNWQRAVGSNERVLHLGDLFWSNHKNSQRQFSSIAKKLTGEKYLILGNHDSSKVDYEALGFTVLEPFSISYKKFTVHFQHHPSNEHLQREIVVHGHIHNNGYSWDQTPPVMRKPGHINVSVEVINYTPQPIERLLDQHIKGRKGNRYVNRKNGKKTRN